MSSHKPDKKLQELARKLFAGEISENEKEELDQWYNSFDDTYHEKVSDETVEQLETRLQQAILEKADINENSPAKRVILWLRIAVAVSIILCIGFYFYQDQHNNAEHVVSARQDISPGRNRAILTLANGKKIDLDIIKKGTVVHQNGLSITKTNSGQLVYEILATKDQTIQNKLSYNTIETPKGGRYSIKLPDGTVVWLNAASSLKYPTQFASNERRVELTGEGYFEVAHDQTKPFKVSSSNQEIEVLGTHFNINAYTEENAIKTTLLEGRVKIKIRQTKEKVQKLIILKPGQQSSFDNMGLTVKDVNTDDAIAWQKGYFKFNREDIQSIMRKLSRWYNFEVVFEAEKDPSLVFGGKVSQTKNLRAILQIMEETGSVHFKIEGRRVIVMK